MQLVRQGRRVYNLGQLIQANYNDQGGPPRLLMLFTNSWDGESWEIELEDEEAVSMWAYLCHRSTNVPVALATSALS